MSTTEEEHFVHLKIVSEELDKNGLVLGFDKCHFCKQQLMSLGSIVT